MTQHLAREIEHVRDRIWALGRQVADQLDQALEALLSADLTIAERVMSTDEMVDQEEVAVEEECLKVIALHQPVARDLRFIVAVLHVNHDLERIGDHAVNLAYIAKKCVEKRATDFPPHIIHMGRLVTDSCHQCIEALVKEDVDAALGLCHDDKNINELCGLVYDAAKQLAIEGRGSFGEAIRIYRVGRELERVGDLLKNIAEVTIYLNTGQVVRHNRLRRLEIEAARTEG